MRISLSFFCMVFSFQAFSQQEKIALKDSVFVKTDSLYREDQFYIGLTYNTLQQKIEGYNRDKFSAGVTLGFVRDMPINKKRTVALGTGLGFTYNNYFQNIGITGTKNETLYQILESNDFDKNKFSQLMIDIPLEFRWRNSTPESYKFWRVYGGLKFSYLLYNKSVLKNDTGKIAIKNNTDFNKFIYGVYLSAGFNTWNVYAYYGLNSIFKSANTVTENIDIKALNVGVMFFIL